MKMEEWKEYNFNDITINYDKNRIPLSSKERETRKGEYRYFGAQGVIDYVDDYIFDGQYILLAEDGENLKSKKQSLVQFVSGKFWVNNHAHILTGNEKCDIKFLFYLLDSIDFTPFITGSAQPKLSQQSLSKIYLKLPPLPTQQKISTILSSIDDKIELNNKINDNLEQQAQAIFKSWFVDFEPFGGNLPEDWRLGTLADIADYYNGYAFSSKELLNEPTDDCLDVFKQGHIKKGGGFNSEGTKSWYPLSKCKNLQNYILKKGDILMAMTDMKGNVAILGNTSIMPVDDKYIVNQRVGLLRAKKDLNIDYPYLYLLTNEHNFLMDLRSRANSGVQVNLSSSAIKESEINIAPKEIYSKFNNIVLPLFEQTLANQLENQKLASLRDNLLPKLMSGELDVDSVQI